ncbi:MAG: serine/threonine-protein kinase [Actinomycetota bacterium]
MDAALIDEMLPERAQASGDEWRFEEGAEIYPGRYALKLLGGGRRYEAYLAFDEELLNNVVVKILRPSRVKDEHALEGLTGELRALEALNHPIIARGFGGVLKGERPHICVEFLEGPRLSTLIRKFGPLPLEQLIPLAVQLCSALHYMHARRMVHLDVKPKNIIMGAPPRLIDLSIARSLRDAAALDVAVGTDAYMAPEQCVPTPGRIGAAADIWGLGVTLYEAVAGELPFPKGSDDDRHPQVKLRPRAFDVRRVPDPIAELVHECLRLDPRTRPTARDVNDRLEPLQAALPRRFVLSRLRPRLR